MTLPQLAQSMRRQAQSIGLDRQQFGDLHLTLQYQAGEWKLSLTTRGQHADEATRLACRRAFGVPEVWSSLDWAPGWFIVRYWWTDQMEQRSGGAEAQLKLLEQQQNSEQPGDPAGRYYET